MRRKRKKKDSVELFKLFESVILREEEAEDPTSGGQTLFGYGKVFGIPLCKCEDPGDYAALFCPDKQNPLHCVLRCWCGNAAKIVFDDLGERYRFIKNRGIVNT